MLYFPISSPCFRQVTQVYDTLLVVSSALKDTDPQASARLAVVSYLLTTDLPLSSTHFCKLAISKTRPQSHLYRTTRSDSHYVLSLPCFFSGTDSRPGASESWRENQSIWSLGRWGMFYWHLSMPPRYRSVPLGPRDKFLG